MTVNKFHQLLNALHGQMVELFKPKENQVILDFIATAVAEKNLPDLLKKAEIGNKTRRECNHEITGINQKT